MGMNSAMNRVIKAISDDPTILASKENIDTHPGRTLEELEMLGLRKGDLIKLESAKLAIRARRYRTSDGTYRGQGRALARLFQRMGVPIGTRKRPKSGRSSSPRRTGKVLASRPTSPREPRAWLGWLTARDKASQCGGFEVRWILIDTGEFT